jgi:tRNA (adenine37-N6)-methyltransferase
MFVLDIINIPAAITSAVVIVGLFLLHRRTTIASDPPTLINTSSHDDDNEDGSVSDDTHFFPPIGILHSCFRECRGTPRQGSFAPTTRGYIQFEKSIPADSLDGLTDFTHVWIVFIFHQNTNLHHSKRAHGSGGSHSFRSKIKPPKLQGKSVGVLATRTPHRPNAIGITLARVESVQGRRVVLSALDLIDGTPILDIKPYVTPYDSVPSARIPHWCGAMPPDVADLSLNDHVIFDDEASQAIDFAAKSGKLQFYDSGVDVRRAIVELLTSDVRPANSYRRSKAKKNETCHFRFDMLLVGFVRQPSADIIARIVDVQIENAKMNKELKAGTRARYTRRSTSKHKKQ